MRFNQKELAFIATRTDIPFDKEGVLWLKEKEGHFWQRNEGNYVTDDFTIKSAGSSLKLSQNDQSQQWMFDSKFPTATLSCLNSLHLLHLLRCGEALRRRQRSFLTFRSSSFPFWSKTAWYLSLQHFNCVTGKQWLRVEIQE